MVSPVVGSTSLLQFAAVPQTLVPAPLSQVAVAALAPCKKTPVQKSARRPARVERKRLRGKAWRKTFTVLEETIDELCKDSKICHVVQTYDKIKRPNFVAQVFINKIYKNYRNF